MTHTFGCVIMKVEGWNSRYMTEDICVYWIFQTIYVLFCFIWSLWAYATALTSQDVPYQTKPTLQGFFLYFQIEYCQRMIIQKVGVTKCTGSLLLASIIWRRLFQKLIQDLLLISIKFPKLNANSFCDPSFFNWLDQALQLFGCNVKIWIFHLTQIWIKQVSYCVGNVSTPEKKF